MVVVEVAANATRPSKIPTKVSCLSIGGPSAESMVIPVPSRLHQPTGEKRNRPYDPLVGMNRMVLWVLRKDSQHVV
jgi:hypothetical protein